MAPKRGSVVLIGSDHAFHDALRRFLEADGLEIGGVDRPERALETIRQAQPQLIVLDLGPGANELARRFLIKFKQEQALKAIPLVAVADAEDAEQQAWARCAGADLFFVKARLLEQKVRPLIAKIDSLLVLAQRSEERRLGLVFTVLVIDDEEDIVERLRLLFKDQPYRFLWASTGQQGLRLAGAELPDLILLDLSMPGMLGEEVCQQLRKQDRWFLVPIAILTGDQRVQKEAQCLDLGADDYLIKTDPPTRLMARIRALIRRRLGADHRSRIEIGEACLDMLKGRLSLAGEDHVVLSPAETSLCTYLMSAAGKYVAPEALCRKLSNGHSVQDADTLMSALAVLKRRLGPLGTLIDGDGSGYRFNVEYASRHGRPRSPG